MIFGIRGNLERVLFFSKNQYAIKDFDDGCILNNADCFSGARTDSLSSKAVHERLKSTGFKSGTMFWTTYKI